MRLKRRSRLFLISSKTFLLPRTSYVHNCWVWAGDGHGFIMCRDPYIPSSFNVETSVTNKRHQEERGVKPCVHLGNPSPEERGVKPCVRLGNPSPLFPTDAVIHCENGKHECGQCFSRRRQARHLYQGSASSSHRNQNHHIRVLTGKTGGLAAMWRHTYTVAVQEAERILHPNHLCQDQCYAVVLLLTVEPQGLPQGIG